MKEFINYTDLSLAPEWIRRRLTDFNTTKLRLHLKRHRRKDQWFSGYCRYRDFLVVVAIHQKMPLPFSLCKPIGSLPNRRRQCGYDYLWQEMEVFNEDQALVWVAGHEIWHYLCKTRQFTGNWETRANKFGFEWLKEFTQETARSQSLFDPPILPVSTPRKLKTVYG